MQCCCCCCGVLDDTVGAWRLGSALSGCVKSPTACSAHKVCSWGFDMAGLHSASPPPLYTPTPTLPLSRGPLTPSLMVARRGMSGSSRVGGSSQLRLGTTVTVASSSSRGVSCLGG
jgi:hypothetical protein